MTCAGLGHPQAASAHALDDTDRRIIENLVRDGRLSVSALADSVHISRAHAYVRLQRLHDAGIIEEYTAQIGFDAAGLHSSAYVALSIRQNSWRGVAAALRALSFVDYFSLLGGDVDVLVLVLERCTAWTVFSRRRPG